MDLVVTIYEVTSTLPKEERYGLSSQIQRAAVAIPSNIAEGYGRGTRKDYAQFLKIARGSLLELKTQLTLLERLPFGRVVKTEKAFLLTEEIGKMLRAMITGLESKR